MTDLIPILKFICVGINPHYFQAEGVIIFLLKGISPFTLKGLIPEGNKLVQGSYYIGPHISICAPRD